MRTCQSWLAFSPEAELVAFVPSSRWWYVTNDMTARRESRETEFGGASASLLLNVDLEVESAGDLAPLIEALEPAAYSLGRPPGHACFELNSAVSSGEPEPVILELVRLVGELPPAALSAWDSASRRVFDIGFQAASRPFQQTHHLKPATLRAIADIGAEVAITIYAPTPADDDVREAADELL